MTVSEQIIDVLDALCDKFGIAVDWTSQNIIPYIETLCRKFITYEIATSIMWMCLMLLFVVILLSTCLSITKKVFKLRYGWSTDDVITYVGAVLWVTFVITSIVALVIIPMQIHDIIEAITFPEKTIIEYVGTLIK